MTGCGNIDRPKPQTIPYPDLARNRIQHPLWSRVVSCFFSLQSLLCGLINGRQNDMWGNNKMYRETDSHFSPQNKNFGPGFTSEWSLLFFPQKSWNPGHGFHVPAETQSHIGVNVRDVQSNICQNKRKITIVISLGISNIGFEYPCRLVYLWLEVNHTSSFSTCEEVWTETQITQTMESEKKNQMLPHGNLWRDAFCQFA